MGRFKEFLTGLVHKMRPEKQWFEDDVEIDGVRYPRLSKFSRPEFSVPLAFLMAHWPAWSRKEKGTFASAFAARPKLVSGDREILDFLMKNGNADAWSMIALLVAREYPDRDRALDFLLARVKERVLPLAHGVRLSKANYYQALGVLGRPECVEELKKALAKHRQYVNAHPSLHSWKMWKDRLVYLDYLSCSATLFRLTGQNEYRMNLETMLQHRNEPVREMARAVVMSSGIAV